MLAIAAMDEASSDEDQTLPAANLPSSLALAATAAVVRVRNTEAEKNAIMGDETDHLKRKVGMMTILLILWPTALVQTGATKSSREANNWWIISSWYWVMIYGKLEHSSSHKLANHIVNKVV
jgi:hypothetical protein